MKLEDIKILELSIMFVPGVGTWQKAFELAQTLNDFLTAHNYDAGINIDASTGKVMIYVEGKMDTMDTLRAESDKPKLPPPQKGVQKSLDSVKAQATRAGDK